MEEEISKYFGKSEVAVMSRSEISLSDYNPRKIDEDGKRQLKRSIKLYGVVGGIVVNRQTGNRVVGGHQKILILDSIHKYPDNDYKLRVEVVDVDERTEKQMNIILNNPAVGGEWDYDKLRSMIPDIDYKDAGLTEADLSMIGMDYIFKTERESGISEEMDILMSGMREEHRQEVERRAEQRAEQREADRAAERAFQEAAEKSYEDKVQHMKEVKQSVTDKARDDAADMDAYVMLSFDTFKAKAAFCQRLGYDGYTKYLKGEDVDSRIDVIE